MKYSIIILVVITLSFTIVNAQWSQIGQDIDGMAEGDLTGWSVSISSDGSVVALSDISSDTNGVNSGQVRVFENNNNIWTQIGQTILGESTDNSFGYSVSINASGSILAIGSPYDDLGGTNSGLVQVFENMNGTWVQIGQNLFGGNPFDQAGWSVSLNAEGNILAIGSDFYGDNGSQTGQVRIYEISNGIWTQLGQDIYGEGEPDNSGWSVSLNDDGTIIAIGAPRNEGVGSQAGHVRIYNYSNGTWTQLGQDINAEAEFDLFGFSVSLNSEGNIVAIGGIHNEGNGSLSGHVRIFELVSENWQQIGADLDGLQNENFGQSVSINNSGTKVAVGVLFGTNNSYGSVRIFENSNNNWQQIGEDIDGESTSDSYGRSVSLDATGTIVAVGSPFSSKNGSNSGLVRVFGDETLSNSQFFKNEISVYPNPTENVLFLKSNFPISKVNVYDVYGKLVFNKQFLKNNREKQINIAHLESGFYLIKIFGNNLVSQLKIVKR